MPWLEKSWLDWGPSKWWSHQSCVIEYCGICKTADISFTAACFVFTRNKNWLSTGCPVLLMFCGDAFLSILTDLSLILLDLMVGWCLMDNLCPSVQKCAWVVDIKLFIQSTLASIIYVSYNIFSKRYSLHVVKIEVLKHFFFKLQVLWHSIKVHYQDEMNVN